jgi:FKBP-type peptidyl-prolyl cis-trans isomerase 2
VIHTLDGSAAVVDFNHPLSDCPVHFEVEILQITPVAQLPPLDSR